jgi:hypothetical protein
VKPIFRYFPATALVLLSLASSPNAQGQTTPSTQPDKFIRFVDRGSAGGELDTADVAYSNGQGVTVHLVAAVHIGEHSYFEGLNKSFTSYDAVLYELVKSKDAGVPTPNDPSTSSVSEFQRFLKNVLDLDFQLDDIDYTAPNFVHADLDKETFDQMEADRGESFTTIMLHQMMDAWNKPDTGPDEDTSQMLHDAVKVITRPDGERQFKIVIARQLGDMEADAMGLNGPDGEVIVTERNKAAIRVLQDQIAAGKKNLAIFYGAAHMTDMSQRLADLGFTPVSTQWRMAWDLTIRPDEPSLVEKALDSAIDALTPSGDGNP